MLNWLQGPGQELLASAESADPTSPADVAALRRRGSASQVHAALQCWQLRRRAAQKFSHAGQMFFEPTALEQATSEPIARHKAARFAGLTRVADLCCGIGGDALGIALAGCPLIAVDYSPLRVAMAKANLRAYQVAEDARFICCDIRQWVPPASAYHIDPSRRASDGGRTAAGRSQPNLQFLRRLVAQHDRVAIKLSPGEHFDRVGIPGELEVISEAGVCKQAMLWCGQFAEVHRRATLLPAGMELSAQNPQECNEPLPICPPQDVQVLYEPDAAIIRARLIGVLARRYDLRLLDRRLAYLAGEPTSRPAGFGQGYRVLEAGHWSLVRVRRRLRAHNVGQVTIKKRAVNIDPQALASRLRTDLPHTATLILARVGQHAWYWLTQPLATR